MYQQQINRLVKTLLILTFFLSVLFSFLLPLTPNFAHLLPLSLSGIKHWYLFQFVTYFFLVSPAPFSLNFVTHLLMNLYLFWLVAPQLIDLLGNKKFLTLYITSGLFAACMSLLMANAISPTALLIGNNFVLYALLLSWSLLNPNSELQIFHQKFLKTKWLIWIFLTIVILYDIGQLNFISLSATLTSLLFAFFFTSFCFKTHYIQSIKEKFFPFGKSKYRPFHETKIYDFKTQKPLVNDDEFMDAMLSKIALYGEDIITPEERRRMDQISLKKRNPHKI